MRFRFNYTCIVLFVRSLLDILKLYVHIIDVAFFKIV